MHPSRDDTGDFAFRLAWQAVHTTLCHRPWLVRLLPEVISDAMLGASQARTRYDPELGPYGPYVLRRAHGAILDGIRDRAPLTRWDAQHGVTIDQTPACQVGTLDTGLALLIPDQRAPLELERITDRDALDRLLALIPARHAMVLRSLYLHDIRPSVLASQMGVSPSRVSQLHREALARLRQLA